MIIIIINHSVGSCCVLGGGRYAFCRVLF